MTTTTTTTTTITTSTTTATTTTHYRYPLPLPFNEAGQTLVQEQIFIEETGILGNCHCKSIYKG